MGQSYRDLIAWQKAMEFVMEIYRNTKNFPRDEVYGLAARLRRPSQFLRISLKGKLDIQRLSFTTAWDVPAVHWWK